ncbi:1,4-dihydroxy-2-naphthoate polyprenyltransferase [Alicyclobacillus cycloheptanicus]|uniref:1,4-dihydroxy-2-naphthoate octaprenyltransferase n=1 Tax=Alicyclobacillus cycloheptanicus TaxID=1457 RepID=A0ABT9XL22_9BACL|nr:1,4-dihydroxy-2-naphthoate polyprenyltransferase [Alicyclobacillus cycloheptanicus]MDQ0191001.1 1,4-dihydroxy-2-naphthoate octaprenyltransferase [Alicyclobacillus cycloheptanicus]WDM00895.1 1,4-dihydroxy-2-naphthoate polyprenyltransferase [Alicyclobacillus cycloheptanicus]
MTWRQRFDIGWRLFRPFTLTASLVPVFVGSGLAWAMGYARIGLFIAFLIASVLIQSATNMFNEYFDYKRGLDTEDMVGISGTIVRDGVAPKTVLRLGWLCIAIAVLLGVYICASTTWIIALVGIACMAVAYLYSGGPYPLAYTPFGELAAATAMGPTIVLLAFYLETGFIDGKAALVSIPIGLLIGSILLGNNIRDMDQDKVGGRRTIAILIGRHRGRILLATVFAVSYLMVIALVLWKDITPWALLVILAAPSAIFPTRQFFRFTEPAKLHSAVKGTSGHLLRFGGLMFVAFLVSVWVR